MKLRINGIYRLPNERELVVRSEEKSESSVVYFLEGLSGPDLHRYALDGNGRLSVRGKLTAWDARDLQDTGRDIID